MPVSTSRVAGETITAADINALATAVNDNETAVAGKANTSHTQASSTITDFTEAVQDVVNGLLVAGSNVTLTYDDAANTYTIASSGGATTSAGISDFTEAAQDATAAMLVAGSNVTLTYDDTANTLAISSAGGGGGGSTAAVDITYAGSTNLSATNVEAALDELDAEKSGTAHAHAAANVTYAGSTNLAATDVEAALDELDAEKAPLSHTQASSTITDFAEAVDDRVATLIVAGANVTKTYDDVANTLTISAAGAGAVAAADVSYAGSTNLSATNVEAALDELDAEKISTADASAAYLNPVHLTAGAFGVRFGTPSLSVVASRHAGWLFDATAVEEIATSWDVPSTWATVDIDFYWTNVGAGSGNVTWRCGMDNAADGGSLAVSTSPPAVTVAAPAQNVLKVTRMASGVAVTPANFNTLSVLRNGGDAGDTLANDAGLLAVQITKVS